MAAAAALTAQASLQPPGANRQALTRAALLAVLAHGVLIVALTLNLDWRWRTPTVLASAELWAAVPQVAAPALMQTAPPPPAPAPAPAPALVPAPTPPPPVAPVRKALPAAEPPRVDAQIAIEKARKAKLAQAQEQEAERQRLLKSQEARRTQQAQEAQKAKDAKKAEQQRQEQAAQRAAKADEVLLAKQREANLERMRGLAGATGAANATGTAAKDAAPSASYGGRIKARIKPNIVLTTDVSGNPITEVEVRCAPDGSIIGRRIIKPSGNSTWDETVLRAIDRTEVLPRDVDGRVPPVLMLVFPRRE